MKVLIEYILIGILWYLVTYEARGNLALIEIITILESVIMLDGGLTGNLAIK